MSKKRRVKNINTYHNCTLEDLQQMPLRQLKMILTSARGRAVCGCNEHCGDDVLTQSERDWNEKQRNLFNLVKQALEQKSELKN